VAETEAEAIIVVTLPADAKLSVDGQATSSTSDKRVLSSPAIQIGKEYQYTLRAEFTRNGKSQSVTKQVRVRGGEETQVNLDLPEAVAAK
jgi:uncharacterized protein (TIGR03000 family)